MSSCCFPTSCKESTHSCIKAINQSKKFDIFLIITLVATLAIGLAGSFGAFNFLGTTNATSLTYSMYLGAILFGVIETARIAIHYCLKTKPLPPQDNHWNNEAITAKGWISPVPEGYTNKTTQPIDPDEIATLKSHVKAFAENHVNLLDDPLNAEELKNDILAYIIHVIEDPRFLENPNAYLDAWKAHRGNSEELRTPQDQAYLYF